MPPDTGVIGTFYRNFLQVEDEEVVKLLREAMK